MKIDVLTYCGGYNYEIYRRFAGSLYDTGFSGKLFFIVTENDVSKVVTLKQTYPKVEFFVDDGSSHAGVAVHSRRFFLKKSLIENHMDDHFKDCDYIFMCDSRDVLFQRNIEDYPFYLPNTEIYVFQEKPFFFEEGRFNTPWIRRIEQLEGGLKELYDRVIVNQKILCVGTILATKKATLHYLNVMCDFYIKHNITEIIDQGLHNYMIYANTPRFSNIVSLSNEHNLVNTVGFDVKKVNDEGLIVNSNGEVSYVVHQYDRFCDEERRKISNKFDFYNSYVDFYYA